MFEKIRSYARSLLWEQPDINKKMFNLQVEAYLQEYLYNHPKYEHPNRISRYEHKGFSQHGEDGIIEEIFNRIGTSSRYFVEFGCGRNGLENNTHLLLLKGWQGLWMDGDPVHVKAISEKFQKLISSKRLSVGSAMITAENINGLFDQFKVPQEFDLLSIDIDGNDYWVWEAIKGFSPRVVVIEYNSVFPSSMKWVMSYNPQYRWDGSCYVGASLKSLELLARQKGYTLVGCDFVGVNAFFVREDLIGEHFFSPYTAENHYELPKYFLEREQGHRREFGDFEIV